MAVATEHSKESGTLLSIRLSAIMNSRGDDNSFYDFRHMEVKTLDRISFDDGTEPSDVTRDSRFFHTGASVTSISTRFLFASIANNEDIPVVCLHVLNMTERALKLKDEIG